MIVITLTGGGVVVDVIHGGRKRVNERRPRFVQEGVSLELLVGGIKVPIEFVCSGKRLIIV